MIEEDTEGGSFFGRLDGVVENLNLEGTISGSVSATFAQDGYGLIINCISGSKIHASKAAAGIVNNWNGTLENVVFQGTWMQPPLLELSALQRGCYAGICKGI